MNFNKQIVSRFLANPLLFVSANFFLSYTDRYAMIDSIWEPVNRNKLTFI